MSADLNQAIKKIYIHNNIWWHLSNKDLWSNVNNAIIITCIVTPPIMYIIFSVDVLECLLSALITKVGDIGMNSIIIFTIFILALLRESINTKGTGY